MRLAAFGLSLALPGLAMPIPAGPGTRPSILESLETALSESTDSSSAGDELAASTAVPAKQLIDAGVKKREAGTLDEAEVLLHAATLISPTNSIGHYELASAHALQRRLDPCFFPVEAIVARLALAVKLDRRLLERARRDPSFDGIKDEILFRLLLHSTLPRALAYPKVFERTELRGRTEKTRDSSLHLDSGGVARRFAPTASDHGDYDAEVSRGTWHLVGETMLVEIDGIGGRYEVGATGAFGDWSPVPNECGR